MGNLNELQQQAAETGGGPHLVLAGPGTGKTTTLTARFAHLVHNGVPPHRILAVTFTRKAGDEMRARLAPMLQINTHQLNVGTFHSFGGKILRQYAGLAGYTPQFRILDEQAQRSVLYRLKIYWNSENGNELTDIFAYAKARMLDAEGFRKDVEEQLRRNQIRANDPLLEAVDHFHDYERALREQDACDFEDLIVHPVHILENNAGARNEVASRFDHILVDEFQDVNEGQFRLLRCLVDPHRNIWCVGDDDQSIYAFRGADAGYTLGFDQHFPGAELWRLGINYRSTEQVLAMAQTLIEGNPERYEKALTPNNGAGPPVVIVGHPSDVDEAAWVVEAVKKVLDKGIPPQQIAVLFRVGQQAFALQLAFQKAGLPHVVRGAGDYWQMAPVRQFRAMLRLAENPGDREARRLMGEGKRAEKFIRSALDRRGRPFPSLVKSVQKELASNPPHFYGPQRVADWTHRLFAASSVALEKGAGLEQWVREQSQAMRTPKTDTITLSTIHGAKGLEWHTVFLSGFEKGLLPHVLCEDEAEERRLAYVALTRAKRYLCLTFSFKRYDESTGPSPHLEEMLAHAPEKAFVVRGELTMENPMAQATLQQTLPKPGSPKKAGAPWTRAEEHKLLRYREAGLSKKAIAEKLKRSQGAVSSRLKQIAEREEDELLEPEEIKWRDRLIAEALTFLPYDEAYEWLNNPLVALDHQSPHEVCTSEKGYKKARKALQKTR